MALLPSSAASLAPRDCTRTCMPRGNWSSALLPVSAPCHLFLLVFVVVVFWGGGGGRGDYGVEGGSNNFIVIMNLHLHVSSSECLH